MISRNFNTNVKTVEQDIEKYLTENNMKVENTFCPLSGKNCNPKCVALEKSIIYPNTMDGLIVFPTQCTAYAITGPAVVQ